MNAKKKLISEKMMKKIIRKATKEKKRQEASVLNARRNPQKYK